MHLCDKTPHQVVFEMMGCSGEDDLVEEIARERATSQIDREEVHVAPALETFLRGADGDGSRSTPKYSNSEKASAQVPAGTAEIEKPARRSEPRPIKLALEFGRSENVLDQDPELGDDTGGQSTASYRFMRRAGASWLLRLLIRGHQTCAKGRPPSGFRRP